MAFGLDSSSFSGASGAELDYVVMQVTLKEKLLGTGSGNLTELEHVINTQVKRDTVFTQLPLQTAVVKVSWAETESRLRWYLKRSCRQTAPCRGKWHAAGKNVAPTDYMMAGLFRQGQPFSSENTSCNGRQDPFHFTAIITENL